MDGDSGEGDADDGDGELDAGVGAEGEGGDEVEDGPSAGPGLGLSGLGGDGDVAGGEVVGATGGGVEETVAVGAGEGAWPVDIATRAARDMTSTSMARVCAMALLWPTEETLGSNKHRKKDWYSKGRGTGQCGWRLIDIDIIYIYITGKRKVKKE